MKTQPLRCIVGEGALVRKRDLPLLVGINLANRPKRTQVPPAVVMMFCLTILAAALLLIGFYEWFSEA